MKKNFILGVFLFKNFVNKIIKIKKSLNISKNKIFDFVANFQILQKYLIFKAFIFNFFTRPTKGTLSFSFDQTEIRESFVSFAFWSSRTRSPPLSKLKVHKKGVPSKNHKKRSSTRTVLFRCRALLLTFPAIFQISWASGLSIERRAISLWNSLFCIKQPCSLKRAFAACPAVCLLKS